MTRVVPHYSAADWYDLRPYDPRTICPRLFIPRKRCLALYPSSTRKPCVCQAIGLRPETRREHALYDLGYKFWDHVRAWKHRGRLVITSEPYTPVAGLHEGVALIRDHLAEYDAVAYVSDESPWWPGSTNLVYICRTGDTIPPRLARALARQEAS